MTYQPPQILFAGQLADQITIAMMTKALQRLSDDDIVKWSSRILVYWDLGAARPTATRLDMDAVRIELFRRATS